MRRTPAYQPVPPRERVASVPALLSAIAMKLLEKRAEDRYQTAAGVEADLRRGLRELEGEGQLDPFALGAHDVPDRLVIPEALYGREREVGRRYMHPWKVAANSSNIATKALGARKMGFL